MRIKNISSQPLPFLISVNYNSLRRDILCSEANHVRSGIRRFFGHVAIN
jgi:hypothetical protein